MTLAQRYNFNRFMAKPAKPSPAPSFKFFDTDAGRNIYFPKERRDCTVRALAIAKAISYSEAHAALYKHAGRMPGEGAYFDQMVIPSGLKCRPDLQARTVGRTLKNLPRSGRFVVSTRDHVFAFVDGYACDTFSPKLRARVKQVYQA